MVRETGDHGPYNSWDRQPYLTHSGVVDGYTPSDKMGLNASILKKADFQTKNFVTPFPPYLRPRRLGHLPGLCSRPGSAHPASATSCS